MHWMEAVGAATNQSFESPRNRLSLLIAATTTAKEKCPPPDCRRLRVNQKHVPSTRDGSTA